MKRIRQTARYLALSAVILAAFYWFGGCQPTARAVLDACERGLHYGPSAPLLEWRSLDWAKGDHTVLVIGKVDSETLSVRKAAQWLPLVWRPAKNGPAGPRAGYGYPHQAWYQGDVGLLFGLVDIEKLPGAASVRVVVTGEETEEEMPHRIKRVEYGDVTMPVDENGFFFAPQRYDLGEEGYARAECKAVYDADGDVIWQE